MPRAFIVGNGYSLKDTNLDSISGEISLACNRIGLIYSETKWRPTHWFFSDAPFVGKDEFKFELRTHLDEGYELFIWQVFRDDMDMFFNIEAYEPRIHYLQFCDHHQQMDSRSPIRPERWHYEDYASGPYGMPIFCKFCGTLNVAFQYAVWKGYDPIIFVGIDADWKPRPTGSEDFNHFHPDYEPWLITPNFTNATMKRQDAVYTHMLNKRFAEEKGITVLNATIGGEIDVYERVDFNGLT